MSSKVAIFIADGTEPLEALAPVDVLRRGGVDVRFVSAMGRQVMLAHNVVVTAEEQIDEADLSQFDVFVVPGGSLGVQNLANSQPVLDALAKATNEGKLIASICAGPTILAGLGLLEGHKATCYPGCEGGFPVGVYVEGPTVVVDDSLITASGPGQATSFGVEILRAMKGDEVSDAVAKGMLL